MFEQIFGVVFPILGGFIGASGGVYIAIHRMQKETAFERRLKWCESVMIALNEAGGAVGNVVQSNDNKERQEKCWNHVLTTYENLIPLCAQKEMYAEEKAISFMQDFMDELYGLIDKHLNSHDDIDEQKRKICINKLQKAAGELSGVARNHLGMRNLPKELIQNEERFLGSFRGRDLGEHGTYFDNKDKISSSI